MVDDRALDPRAIEMLATLLVQNNGGPPAAPGSPASNIRTGRRTAKRR
jgi:hypothetical protein